METKDVEKKKANSQVESNVGADSPSPRRFDKRIDRADPFDSSMDLIHEREKSKSVFLYDQTHDERRRISPSSSFDLDA